MMGSTESLDEVENGPIYGMDSALAGSVISLHSSKTNVLAHVFFSLFTFSEAQSFRGVAVLEEGIDS
jgi:hypothetical protein